MAQSILAMATKRKRQPMPVENPDFAAIRLALLALADAIRPIVHGTGAAPLADLLDGMQRITARSEKKARRIEATFRARQQRR